jgi:Protein of unknown function (DUF1501)
MPFLPHRPSRRSFLRAAAGGAVALAASPVNRALADTSAGETEFFVFVHASGGWDITLWSDPRNEKRGIIDPATTENTDTSQIKRWVDAPFRGDARTFAPVRPPGSNITFGPGIGDLAELYDRITLVNGLSMNTVSHPDGTAFSTTGRHLNGSRVPASSVDTLLASEYGKSQLFPAVSVQFPSSYAGEPGLDRRAVPLVVGQIGTISRSLIRSGQYDTDADRDAVTALLSKEAQVIASRSTYTDVLNGVSVQYEGLRKMLGSNLQEVFSANRLRQDHPELDYKARFAGNTAVNAAFVIEALKRNVVRTVGFGMGGFDTHNANYKQQAQVQQELFGLVHSLVRVLDKTPHPTLASKKLSDHTHILVVSDFCRTPQINLGGGRDHYPCNSALVISPRFRGNLVFGKSDPDQVLPAHAKRFSDGDRAISPPDLLATFVSAFGVPPRRYMRDGEIVPELLKS